MLEVADIRISRHIDNEIMSVAAIGVSYCPAMEITYRLHNGESKPVSACPELLRREYWGRSPWIGIAGYAVAAGAGLGIMCTQAAYWLYPVVTKTFFRKRYNRLFVDPAIGIGSVGQSAQIVF